MNLSRFQIQLILDLLAERRDIVVDVDEEWTSECTEMLIKNLNAAEDVVEKLRTHWSRSY